MKVLVVDDDVVSRMVLMHLVDACGQFDILEAEDGEDAWQQMAGGLRPAICFCDLRMPRLSGMDLLARVRADPALAAMPFVLVTSANDTATVDRANGLGADGYLVKPFDAVAVSACIAPLLAVAESQSAAPAEPDAETPLATMARLGIDGERLLVYLGGFQTQLAAASTELAALLASGDVEGAHVRLDRLHAGCQTLGLNRAAGAIRDLPDGALDPADVQITLAETVRAVLRQSAVLRALHG
jgi:two-component system chemotaxis response regulator CheY